MWPLSSPRARRRRPARTCGLAAAAATHPSCRRVSRTRPTTRTRPAACTRSTRQAATLRRTASRCTARWTAGTEAGGWCSSAAAAPPSTFTAGGRTTSTASGSCLTRTAATAATCGWGSTRCTASPATCPARLGGRCTRRPRTTRGSTSGTGSALSPRVTSTACACPAPSSATRSGTTTTTTSSTRRTPARPDAVTRTREAGGMADGASARACTVVFLALVTLRLMAVAHRCALPASFCAISAILPLTAQPLHGA